MISGKDFVKSNMSKIMSFLLIYVAEMIKSDNKSARLEFSKCLLLRKLYPK